MRLQATDGAIKTLTRNVKPEAFKSGRAAVASLLTWPESRRVRWEEALRIRRPECYNISIGPSPGPNYIILVVDRRRHFVYVYRHFI